MKRFLVILAFILPTILICQNPDGFNKMIERNVEDSVPYIQAEDLHKLHKSNGVLILDTRKSKEYKVSHIEGAVFIEYDDFNLNQLNGIPKDKKIVIYCAIGYRSGKIGEKLMAAGYQNVSNLYGGIFNWVNNGYPVVNSKGKKVKKVHGYNLIWKRWVNEQRAEAILN